MLSLAEMERRTGSLLLIHGDETINLYLRDGAIVRVELPPCHDARTGIDRVFFALGWQAGQFELSAAEVLVEDEIELPTSYILLEYARRQDEDKQVTAAQNAQTGP